MLFRKAVHSDGQILREWLDNEEDCLFVIGKSEYTSEDFFHWLEAEDQHCYLLINQSGTTLGYGEIWVDEKEKDLELAHLIINPKMRSLGLGRILVNQLEDKAR